jgi:tripartite ATP-independent transporter DctP family solute receptor
MNRGSAVMAKRFWRAAAERAAVALMALFWTAGAKAQDFTLRFSHVVAAKDDVTSRAALLFQKEVEENSKGRIRVQMFFGGQLGTLPAITDQVKDGTIQMDTVGFPFLAKYVPDVQVVLLPFLFKDEAEAHKAFDGPLGDDIIATVLKKSGIRILAVGEFGFSDLLTRKGPIRTLADMKGLKVRSTPNALSVQTFSLLGAIPVTLDLAEIYTGIQRGAVDGSDLAARSVYSGKFYEVGKYLTLTHHSFQPMLFNMNNKFFESLPPDLQAVVQKAAIDARDYNRKEILTEQAEAIGQLEAKKVVITTLTPEALDQFRKAEAPLYSNAQSMLSLGPDGMRWLAELTKPH